MEARRRNEIEPDSSYLTALCMKCCCWSSIVQAAWTKQGVAARLRYLLYAGGWKKFEPLWNLMIRAKQVACMLPVLESIPANFGKLPSYANDVVSSVSLRTNSASRPTAGNISVAVEAAETFPFTESIAGGRHAPLPPNKRTARADY
jgi:hypothetical protein